MCIRDRKYLSRQGIYDLDIIVGSHNHSDHIGGFPDLLDDIEVGRAYISPNLTGKYTCEKFLENLDKYEVETFTPAAGETFELGEAQCQFLADGAGFEDVNNSSLVLKVTYKDVSVLFTGDIEREAENKLLDSGFDPKCDILKVAHHGSSTSSTKKFLAAADPDIAVISCGTDNDYGHPHKETLSKLKDTAVYRTDLLGDIVFVSDGYGFEYLED